MDSTVDGDFLEIRLTYSYKQTSMMSAATAVFSTAELLKSILIHLSVLSIGDLWRTQHINKSAREVIRSSRILGARLFAVVYPSNDLAQGASYNVLDRVLFDCRFASQREGHHWRRVLDISRRNIEKPEGPVPRVITKCVNIAKLIRQRHAEKTMTVFLGWKDVTESEEWRKRWMVNPKNVHPTEYEKVKVVFALAVSGGNIAPGDDSCKTKAWAEVTVPKGRTTKELVNVVTHLVVAHPYTGELLPGIAPGTPKDPLVLRWKGNIYSRVHSRARKTAAARRFMSGEPTYGVEIPAKEDFLWRKLRSKPALNR